MKAVLALIVVILSLLVLETARQGVSITQVAVGETPVTRYARVSADGPVVVVAHGFAGSQQMMQGYVLPLAQAGYQVYAFEFLGHGRHTAPMSGDVNALDGTTRLLVAQTEAVLDAVDAGGVPVALLGHSMATDILARVAQERDDIGPLVLLSAFSQVINANFPPDLLLITGSWEPGLRGFAQAAVQMVDPTATTGETVMDGDLRRRAVIAPMTEHVSILQSRAGRGEAVAWLDEFYGRQSQPSILPTGTTILGLLVGVVLLFGPIAARLPQRQIEATLVGRQQLAVMLVVPLVLTPLIAVPLSPSFLPVLVADYLGLHLLIFGGIQLALLWWWQIRIGPIAWGAVALLLLWCALFGFLLDRYAANFLPTPQRVWIMAVLALGAVPYMLADMVLSAQAGFLRRLAVRLAFLISLGIAVALDFEGLFFLIMIAPVLVLFYAVFGTMGRHVARRSGPAASGLVLGLVLAWALGVSFPLFVGM
jgi:pimeloyl-ACP methyl ester carboxylesterase